MSDEAAPSQPEKSPRVATLRWTALAIFMVLAVGGGYAYWRHSEIYPSTDNAYTAANIVRVAAQVSGAALRVYVQNNERVAENDPLFDIEPGPYDAQLRGAQAQFEVSASDAGDAAANIRDSWQKLKDQFQKLQEARTAYQTSRDQANSGNTEASDAAKTAWRQALEAFEQAQSDFGAAQEAQIENTPDTAQLRTAAAQLDKALRDRVRTYVSAPVAGVVTELNLRPGAMVGAGSPQFALVDTARWWVDANFKETDLNRMQPGQPATITLDMYPEMAIEGVVDSISAGSGQTFSALPAENATGNWVKVTQRFTVRVAIPKPPEDPNRPLRVGASAHVQVDTQGSQNGVEQAQK